MYYDRSNKINKYYDRVAMIVLLFGFIIGAVFGSYLFFCKDLLFYSIIITAVIWIISVVAALILYDKGYKTQILADIWVTLCQIEHKIKR